MAVDTQEKRFSIVGYGAVGVNVFPEPDGSLDTEAERKLVVGVYTGELQQTTTGGFNVFDPPRAPSQPLTDEPEFRIANAEFGDGYEQRAPKGINWKRSVVNVSWRTITRSEAKTILDFFYDQEFDPFYYTLPYESTQRKWVAVKWSREDRVDGYVDIQATWRESFELDS